MRWLWIIALVLSLAAGAAEARVARSQRMRLAYLRAHHMTRVPRGYQIDHVVPLWRGGRDDPSNMQLLSIQEHRRKTAKEARQRAAGAAKLDATFAPELGFAGTSWQRPPR